MKNYNVFIFFIFTLMNSSYAQFKTPSSPVNLEMIEKKVTSSGIEFKYFSEIPIFATDKGILVYVGELEDYGRVIIVDHKDATRSIFLGDFSTLLTKGDIVKEGQIIGYTNKKKSTDGILFFQVRKNNKPIKL